MPLPATLEPPTQLNLGDRPLVLDTDYAPLTSTAEGRFNGSVIFAGYGITRPGYDDYAGLDVRNKIVLAMRQEPRDAHGASRFAKAGHAWSDDALYSTKARNAAVHGAAALLLVQPPAASGTDTVPHYVGESAAVSSSPLPTILITRRVADLLLTTADQPGLPVFESAIDALGRPKSAALNRVSLSGEVALRRRSVAVRNIVGEIPGVGPQANEFVVIGAHYDHLGTGQLGHVMGPAGQIFHGADDNASGTAAVLETVDRLRAGLPLPRSVIVALFTGEEEGLVGSAWFVKHPPVPLRSIVAMLNLDMVGRLKNQNLLLGGWGTAPAFDGVLHDAVAGLPVTTQSFEKGGLGPSDHMSFALQKIPVLFLFTGLHADYHRPTDTADKINYAGLDLISQIAERIVRELAALPRQTYDDRSDSMSTMADALGRGTGEHASLGVVPDFGSSDATAGVFISGTTPGTAAAKAGFVAGDRLIQFGGHPLNNLQDLSDVLNEAKPGDTVDVRYVRNGKTLAVRLVLGSRASH